MTTQLNIFGGADPNVPHVAGSVTSKNAADSIRPHVESQRERVYAWLCAFGPASDEQMQDALDMPANTQRPRRVELLAAGRVVDSGRTVTTRSGRNAVAWKAIAHKS